MALSNVTKIQLTFMQNDVKPLVVSSVTSSTGSAISAATYNLNERFAGTVITTNGTVTVSGTTISTPNITWGTVGQFIATFKVTFADGIIDNSISCYVTVLPPSS